MKLNFTIALFFFINTTIISAQQLPLEWVRSFQGQGKASDRIAAITTDVAGNIYVAGYAGAHHGSPDAFAMKRNPQGDTLWIYYYDSGGHHDDYATDIVVDNAGNAYITGHSADSATYVNQCFTAKILPSGTPSWVTRYAPGGNTESYGNALTVDPMGNVYVAGYSDPTSGADDWLVIKYNASGVQQWADVLNGPGNGDDEALAIALAPNGNPTVCGYAYSLNASGNINAFVKQYTPANGTVFTATWNHPSFTGYDRAMGLGFNASGEVFIGGTTMNNSVTNNDAFAVKYDVSGNQQWSTIYTDANTLADEYLADVKTDPAGNIFFTGSDFQNGFVTCIYNDGTPGWRKKWSGPASNGYDVFHSLALDNAGNVYATGRGVYPGPDYYGNNGLPNMIIAKYNSNGDSLWTYRCADSLNSSMGFAVTCSNDKVYAGGFVTDTAYVDENLYTLVVDTSVNSISEWDYNGKGDAVTMGQFVQIDAANNIYCAATVDRLYTQGMDVAIIKYDPVGNLLWEKYYSSPGWNNDTLTGMQMDPSGNLILSISTDSLLTPNYRQSLLKVDADGNFLDTAWYTGMTGSVLAKSMVIRNDGSVALAANSNINGGIVVFFDQAFNWAWAAKIDSTQSIQTRANSVDVFPNGDIAVGGFAQLSGVSNGLVQRYNAAGNRLWYTVIDSAGVYDEIRDVTVNASGDVAFTGASGGTVSYFALVGMLDGATGNETWHQVYNAPSSNYEYGSRIRFTPAGNIAFICRGWTGFVARYITVQYSGTGSFQWANVYSQTASDREPVDILVEPSNRVVTAGWAINSFSTNYDYVLTGYEQGGTVSFQNTYNTISVPLSTWDQLYDLERDNLGHFIVTGRSTSDFFNNWLYRILTLKYGPTPVGIEESNIAEMQSAYVYPNPSLNGIFTLIDASPYPIESARVYDMQGRFITSMDLSTGELNLGDYHAGLYILVLERQTGSFEHFRLIRN